MGSRTQVDDCSEVDTLGLPYNFGAEAEMAAIRENKRKLASHTYVYAVPHIRICRWSETVTTVRVCQVWRLESKACTPSIF